LKAPLSNPTFIGNVTAPTFIGALSGNAASATKLQTARTIWGQSFNGTGNVSGALTGVGDITPSSTRVQVIGSDTNMFERVYSRTFDTTSGWAMRFLVGGSEHLTISAIGNIGIGISSSINYKLDVNGTGRFTGDLTAPKVIFSAAGWLLEQVGTELQIKH